MGRKQNPEQRRRDLCDAAIELLAEGGIKAVTHLKVDRHAGLPDGTTSFYFRTSSALLHAVAARIADLDLADLTAATATKDDSASPATGLAELVMHTASGERLVRSKARHELAMPSSRDERLGEAFSRHQQQFVELHRDIVVRLSPARTPATAIDERAFILMMFISGLLIAIARGDHTIRSAAQLEAIIVSLATGAVTGRTSTRR